MKGLDGMDVLQAIHEIDADTPVVIMTAFGAVDSAVDAIRRGAYHYVTKPFKLDIVRVLLERAIAKRAVRVENEESSAHGATGADRGNVISRDAGIKAVTDSLAESHRHLCPCWSWVRRGEVKN